MNIAHRGARTLAPENTLIAARKAYDAGADGWEFDVQLAKDDKLVITHDTTLTRTTDVEEVFPNRLNYNVSEFSLDEIKQLDAGSWFVTSDPFGEIGKGNVTVGDRKTYSAEKIPTLKEALMLTQHLNWKANIELKPMNIPTKRMRGVVNKVAADLKKMEMEDQVFVSSFNHSAIQVLRKRNPNIHGAILIDKPLNNPVQYMEANGVKILSVLASVLETQQGIANLEAISHSISGYNVFVWTINNHVDMIKAIGNPHVTGLITDYPRRLREILNGS